MGQFCKNCKDELKHSLPTVKGDGYCKKHKIRYSFSHEKLASSCPTCATEKKVCGMCGDKLKGLTFYLP